MRKGIQITVVIAMLGLWGTYYSLNANKLVLLSSQYKSIAQGESAQRVELILDDRVLIRHRLRSSDLFDAGQHQLSFVQLEPVQYQALRENAEDIQLSINGDRVLFVWEERGKALEFVWSDRKLVFVHKGDLRTIVANVWRDNIRDQDILKCFGEDLCQSIQINGEGWGRLEGPYLKSEENTTKRGLPRGRWMYGPATKIAIDSKTATDVLIAIDILRINPNQTIQLQGPELAVKSLPTKPYSRPYGGLALYPLSSLIQVALKPGRNQILFQHSKWHTPNIHERRPLAVYVTGFNIKRAKTPEHKSNNR